jgi:hypothetical protein
MQYVDANGTRSKVFSEPFRVDAIAIVFQQLPRDFSTNTIPGSFSIGVLGSTGAELYTYRYSIDDDSLREKHDDFALGVLSVNGLTPGSHQLFIQGTAQDGKQTPVVTFPFVVN